MRYGLTSLAEAEIESLEADGIRLTAQDIMRIAALSARVETPHSSLSLARGIPVSIGGVYLWPMTLNATDWFQRIGGELGGVDIQTLALAYCMANGREDLPEDPKDAKKAVVTWGKRLKCRNNELVEAIRQVVNQDDHLDAGKTSKPASMGDISVMLAAMTKTSPEVWERQCSMSYVLAMLETIVAQNAADGKSLKGDPRIKAERALGMAIKSIRDRHNAKQAHNG